MAHPVLVSAGTGAPMGLGGTCRRGRAALRCRERDPRAGRRTCTDPGPGSEEMRVKREPLPAPAVEFPPQAPSWTAAVGARSSTCFPDVPPGDRAPALRPVRTRIRNPRPVCSDFWPTSPGRPDGAPRPLRRDIPTMPRTGRIRLPMFFAAHHPAPGVRAPILSPSPFSGF